MWQSGGDQRCAGEDGEVAIAFMGIGLDAWWNEPDYKPCNTLHLRGLFIFRKLRELDPAKFQEVMTYLYRDDQPDPQDIARFERQTILAYMGASEDEIPDGQTSI